MVFCELSCLLALAAISPTEVVRADWAEQRKGETQNALNAQNPQKTSKVTRATGGD